MEPLPQKILVISTEHKDEIQLCGELLFKQLGLLWKIPVDIAYAETIDEDKLWENGHPKYCMVAFTALNSGNPIPIDAHQWTIIEKYGKNVPLLAFYKAAKIKHYIDKIWSVKQVSNINIKSGKLIVYNDKYTNNVPHTMQIEHVNKYFLKIDVTDKPTILATIGKHLPVVVRNGLNVYFAIHPWQFGIISFRPFFKMLENIIFLTTKMAHFAPGDYASIRIDDMPYTTYHFIKYGMRKDRHALSRIKLIQRAAYRHGVKIEYMITSHFWDKKRKVTIDRKFPKTIEYMKSLYAKKLININAHGNIHFNVAQYFRSYKAYPTEYIGLDIMRTEKLLTETIHTIKSIFNKIPKGFVAPAYGYEPNVTKLVAAKYFDYIIDSNYNLRNGNCELFGYYQQYISMPETWEFPISDINYYDINVWKAYLDVGLPIHIMQHDAFYSRNFLTRVLYSVARYLSMPQILYKLRTDVNLAKIILTGTKVGVKWIFLEDLAHHMRQYFLMSIGEVKKEAAYITYVLQVPESFKLPFQVITPYLIKEAKIDGKKLSIMRSKVLIPPLKAGIHSLYLNYIY